MKRPAPDTPFDHAVRDVGRSTTPEELRSRGVRRIRSVTPAELSRLIERAINQSLLERTFQLDEDEMESLVEQAHQRMLVQMERQVELRERWRRLDEARRELEEEDPEEPVVHEDTLIAASEQALVLRARELFRGSRVPESLRQSIVDESCRVLRKNGRKVASTVLESKDREVALLRRRVKKLLSRLDETEQALERAIHAGPVEEVPVPRLDASLANRKVSRTPQRQKMLRQVFELNRQLQQVTS